MTFSTNWFRFLLPALLLALAPAVRAEQTFRVGSFMINELGRDAEAEYDRSLLSLTTIIRGMNVDALALQGVRDTEAGRAQAQRLTNMLNRAAKNEDEESYQIAFGPGGEQEVATFLWRHPVKALADPVPMLPENAVDEAGRKHFPLMPQSARFAAASFEFDPRRLREILPEEV